jgi:urease subunit alpha
LPAKKISGILDQSYETYVALSIYCTDSQAIGRVGEVATRAWQIADKMRRITGRLKKENGHNDNLLVKRQ